MDHEVVSKIEITKEWGLERKWWILLAVGVGTFMSALDGSVVKPAAPSNRHLLPVLVLRGPGMASCPP